MIKQALSLFLIAISLSLTPALVHAQDAEPASQHVVSVNINTASAEELSSMLVGIGDVKAEAIVAYRDEYGAFQSVDELMDVKGIGQSTIDKNRALIVFK